MTNEIIAQLNPYPGSMALMYYDASGPGVIGDLFFVNKGTNADNVRIAITLVNQSPTDGSYLMYDAQIAPSHTVGLQKICLGNQERLYVYSLTGGTNFTYTGTEF